METRKHRWGKRRRKKRARVKKKKRARNEPNDYLVHAPSTTLRRTAMEKVVVPGQM